MQTTDHAHSPLAAPAVLIEWLNERCEPGDTTSGTSLSLLYEDFKIFAKPPVWSITAFARSLMYNGFPARKVSNAHGSHRQLPLVLKSDAVSNWRYDSALGWIKTFSWGPALDTPLDLGRTQVRQVVGEPISPAGWKRWTGTEWAYLIGPVDACPLRAATRLREFQSRISGMGQGLQVFAVESENEGAVLGREHGEVRQSLGAERLETNLLRFERGGCSGVENANGRGCELVGDLDGIDWIEDQSPRSAVDRHFSDGIGTSNADLHVGHVQYRHEHLRITSSPERVSGAVQDIHLARPDPADPAPCRADTFCRCRRCKPPLSEMRAARRSKRAAVAVAGLFFLCIALQLVRAWIGGRL